MATCERVVKEPVPPPVEYVLRLSEDEASSLRAVLQWVSSPNKEAGAIYTALVMADAPLRHVMKDGRGITVNMR